MLLIVSIYAALVSVACMFLMAPKIKSISHRKKGLITARSKELKGLSDFETARALMKKISAPGEWKLSDKTKNKLNEYIASEKKFNVSDIIIAGTELGVNHTLKNTGMNCKIFDFSPAEQTELVELYYKGWAEKVDQYVESKKSIAEAEKRAAQKHAAQIEARQSATKEVDSAQSSWETQYLTSGG